jgi:hypothetical protein
MWKRKTLWALALALAALALAAGCGGDDGDETDPKEEYIAQGDEICARGTFTIGSQARERYGTPQPPPKKIEEYSEQIVVPTLQTEVVDKLRALPAPEGDEQTTAAIYDELQRAIDELRADPGLLAEQNVGGAFDEANRLAQAYGFRQCGSN